MPRLSYDMHLIPLGKMPAALKLLQEHGFVTCSFKSLSVQDFKSKEVAYRGHAGFVSLNYFK